MHFFLSNSIAVLPQAVSSYTTQDIGQAYSTLKDASKREKYDRKQAGGKDGDDDDFSSPFTGFNNAEFFAMMMRQMYGMRVPPGFTFGHMGGGGFYAADEEDWEEEPPPSKGARARRGHGRR